MTNEEMRLLDIRIAMAFGFKVEKSTMYSPKGTLMGGDFSVHIGSVKETDQHITNTWMSYTPRFTKNMNDAIWLLVHAREEHHLEYNLFSDGEHHTCEFGYWVNEPGKPDMVYTASEDTPELAISKAVAQCPVIMGKWATERENKHTSFGLSDNEIAISVYGDPGMSDKTKSALLNMAKVAKDAIENGKLGSKSEGE